MSPCIKRFAGSLFFFLALVLSVNASAQTAEKPLVLVVPYPPGGPADTVARVIAPVLGSELNRDIVIDNRAGASGMIGASFVARAAPDGNTLLLNPTIHVILPSLIRDMSYDAIKDFTHIGALVSVPLILAINKDIPATSVDQLVDYSRKHMGSMNFASSSIGSSAHLAGEEFSALKKLGIQHVPYKGSAPAITELIGGRIQLMFDSAPSILPFVQSGKVRALAVTSATRSKVAPELPTMVEAGYPDFVYGNWYGVWGPKGMPADKVNTLIAAMQRTLQNKELIKRLVEQLGAEPTDGLFGEKFKAFAVSEEARYGKLVKAANIQPQ